MKRAAAPETDLPDDLITPPEAARILHTHLATIHRWIQSGSIRAWKRCMRGDVNRYLLSEADVRARLRPYQPPTMPASKAEIEDGYAASVRHLRARGAMD